MYFLLNLPPTNPKGSSLSPNSPCPPCRGSVCKQTFALLFLAPDLTTFLFSDTDILDCNFRSLDLLPSHTFWYAVISFLTYGLFGSVLFVFHVLEAFPDFFL